MRRNKALGCGPSRGLHVVCRQGSPEPARGTAGRPLEEVLAYQKWELYLAGKMTLSDELSALSLGPTKFYEWAIARSGELFLRLVQSRVWSSTKPNKRASAFPFNLAPCLHEGCTLAHCFFVASNQIVYYTCRDCVSRDVLLELASRVVETASLSSVSLQAPSPHLSIGPVGSVSVACFIAGPVMCIDCLQGFIQGGGVRGGVGVAVPIDEMSPYLGITRHCPYAHE